MMMVMVLISPISHPTSSTTTAKTSNKPPKNEVGVFFYQHPKFPHQFHGRARLEDEYEDEKGDADGHKGYGEAPVCGGNCEGCYAEDALRSHG